MRKTTLKNAKQLLLDMKRQILREISEDLKHGREGAKDDGMDTYDLASEERDREINFILSDREREKLQSIEEALERIEDGSYGICESCEAEIAPARLEAMPFSRLCVSCQAEREKEAKQLRRFDDERAYRRLATADVDEEQLLSPTSGTGEAGLVKRAPPRPPWHGRGTLHESRVPSPGFPQARQDLLRIFRAAVAAVDPAALTQRYLIDHPPPSAATQVLLVGAGKAAARMAAGCEAALGARRVGGLAIVPDGCEVPLASVELQVAGHPLPDQRGAHGTAALCRVLAAPGEHPVFCLISGGASSLLVKPLSPVTLDEKMEVNRLLLASGAEITEVNTARKHLSAVKGGGLLRLVRARPVVTLVLSDVIGDDPSVIGSGPTTPDPSTFSDALAVLQRYALTDLVAPAVRDLLDRGAHGALPETVKPGDPETRGASTVVIGNNRLALAAAAAEARRLGYEPLVDETALCGDTTDSAWRWLHDVRARIDGCRACAIVGGETTVVVRGQGRGGRNQEFALALVEPLAGASAAVLSAGTDGVDGPTDAAGALVDGHSLARAQAIGLDPAAALTDNDSYGFFSQLDDLLRCGPTGTNVMDIKLALGLPSSR